MSKCNERTEIYSRVCGFFRPIAGWNPGKKQEYLERENYEVNSKTPLKKDN